MFKSHTSTLHYFWHTKSQNQDYSHTSVFTHAAESESKKKKVRCI